MRLLGVLPVLAAGAVLSGAAAAGPVPVPPVPVPVTVPTPTVPVSVPPAPIPLPVIPKLPKPVVPEPVKQVSSAPSAPLPSVSGVSGSPAVVAGSGGGQGSNAASSSSSSSSSSARVDHFHSSRHWIGTTGPKRRRTTTFTFTLQQAGPVVFTVNQVSPACVGIGRFTVAGRAGLNRVRFRGIVHGRRLAPGTYRISIRTAGGAIVRRITLVVVGGAAPSRGELRQLRAANTCKGGAAAAVSTGRAPTSAAPSAPAATAEVPSPPTQSEQPVASGLGVPARGPNLHSGVLGSSVAKTAEAVRPLLLALLALAILLLAVASLPREAVPEARMHYLLARHRAEIAGLGAAALVAVAIAFLLS